MRFYHIKNYDIDLDKVSAMRKMEDESLGEYWFEVIMPGGKVQVDFSSKLTRDMHYDSFYQEWTDK